MTEKADLESGLHQLGLPQSAIDWLLDVYHVIQVLDDARDGDPIKAQDADEAVRAIFGRMPFNQFFNQVSGAVGPILALQSLKWRTANEAEERGVADERSFMWRAGYYDLVASVCLMCNMEESAKAALNFYGESFKDYRKEFPCLRQ